MAKNSHDMEVHNTPTTPPDRPKPPTPSRLPSEILQEIFAYFLLAQPPPCTSSLSFLQQPPPEDYASGDSQCSLEDLDAPLPTDIMTLFACSLVSTEWNNVAYPMLRPYLNIIVVEAASARQMRLLGSLFQEAKTYGLKHSSDVGEVQVQVTLYLQPDAETIDDPLDAESTDHPDNDNCESELALAFTRFVNAILPLKKLVLKHDHDDSQPIGDIPAHRTFLTGLAPHCSPVELLEFSERNPDIDPYFTCKFRSRQPTPIANVEIEAFARHVYEHGNGAPLALLDHVENRVVGLRLVRVSRSMWVRERCAKFGELEHFRSDDENARCYKHEDEYVARHAFPNTIASWPSLRTFTLTDSKIASDTVLLELARSCPNLTDLHIFPSTTFPLFSATILAVVLGACPHLASLSIIRTRVVDNDLLRVLLTVPRALHTINFAECPEITGELGPGEIKIGCTTLRELRMRGCDNVKPAFVVTVLRLFEEVRTIQLPAHLEKGSFMKALLRSHGFALDRADMCWRRKDLGVGQDAMVRESNGDAILEEHANAIDKMAKLRNFLDSIKF
ncbi:hypothetical protein BC936DRAFT_143178 [Jimgerdemannia flammicorona]|uniref:F-box domain-containing protein n=1 Tax=Jimgerdemannia flammicorona TaxID=994334 RepID=A0A433DE84_9FUNG|nr:hypothetical protein BC936DRAFT_143178 [Jimgerdemannia flammicorona]